MAVLLLVCVARAQSQDVNRVIGALRSGSWDDIERLVAPLKREGAGTEPAVVKRLCRMAADRAYEMAWDERDGWTAVNTFDSYAKVIAEKSPDNADVEDALGETALLRARALCSEFTEDGFQAPRRRQSPEHFRLAAEHFARSYELDDGNGMALARAVLSRIEDGWVDVVAREDARAAATAWTEKLESADPSSPASVLARALLDYDRARTLVSIKEYRDAKEPLEAAATRLRPLADDRDSDIEIPTLYNAVVALALAHARDLRLDLEFAAEDWRARYLWTRLPRSRLVTSDRSRGSQRFGRIMQWSIDGGTVRKFVFYEYEWDTEYTTGPRGIGGDNPKGLIQGSYDDDVQIFERRIRNRRVTKGRLNRSIASGYRYEVVGTDQYSQTWAYRCYCFKAKENRITLQVWIEELGGEVDIDPAGEFIVDAMREKPAD